MKKLIIMFVTVALILTIVACAQQINPDTKPAQKQLRNIYETFDFENGRQGFKAGFADYPKGEEKFYELDSGVEEIPGLDTKGFMLRGNNHSDDLLMYITRGFKVSPNTTYTIDLKFKLATNVPPGMSGIGGSPGASVFVKAGANSYPFKPQVDDNRYLRPNWDIGSQSSGGKDTVVVGDIEKVNSDDDSYQFKCYEAQFEVESDKSGKIYILLATDSGFEGLTKIYFDDVVVKMTAQK